MIFLNFNFLIILLNSFKVLIVKNIFTIILFFYSINEYVYYINLYYVYYINYKSLIIKLFFIKLQF